MYLLTKICLYVSTWVLIIAVAECYVFEKELKEFGLCDIVDNYVEIAKESVQKFIDMIPKYQWNDKRISRWFIKQIVKV